MRLLAYGVAACLVALIATPAAAENCGPNFATYRHERLGVDGYGVRCVQFLAPYADPIAARERIPTGDMRFGVVWYGEGEANGGLYRHGGALSVFFRADDPIVEFRQTDFFGNGEDYRGEIDRRLRPTDVQFVTARGVLDAWSVRPDDRPTQIRFIEGGRVAMVWDLAPPGTATGYRSALPPLRNCEGPGTGVAVYAPDGTRRDGVRCRFALTYHLAYSHANTERYGHVSFYVGAGANGGREYLHLMFRTRAGSGDAAWSVVDICLKPNWFCNYWRDSVRLRHVPQEPELRDLEWPNGIAARYLIEGPLNAIWAAAE